MKSQNASDYNRYQYYCSDGLLSLGSSIRAHSVSKRNRKSQVITLVAGNRRKDLVLEWKTLFHLFQPLKLQHQKRKKDGGKQDRSSSVFLALGTTEPQKIAHSQCVLPFSSGVKQKASFSFTSSMTFFASYPQLYSKSVPVWCQQQQQGWHLCSLTVPPCRAACLSLVWCCSRATSTPFCFRDVRRSGRRKKASLLQPRVVELRYITYAILTYKGILFLIRLTFWKCA